MADVFGPLAGSRLGEINSGGDYDALYLTDFSGEIMGALRSNLVTEGRVLRKYVPPGKDSVQFRLMGSGAVKRHIYGKNLLVDDASDGGKFMQKIPQGEIRAYLDRELTNTTFSETWEEERNSFESRGPFAMELGIDLAEQIDTERFLLMLKAATNALSAGFKANLPTGFPQTGQILTDSNYDTDGAALMAGLKSARQWFLEKKLGPGGQHVALAPAQYLNLVDNKDLLNRDFGGANGIYSQGEVYFAWGMMLHMTNNMPTTDYSSTADMATGVNGEDYQVNATNTVAIAWHESCMGTCEAHGIGVEAEYKFELRGTPIVASATVGHEILRAEGFQQLRTAAP